MCEQPDEEINSARSGTILSAGASISVELWGVTPQYVNVFTNLKAL